MKAYTACDSLTKRQTWCTLSSQASSSMSRASMDTALLWSCSCVTSSSMPQLLKNSTLARSSTRRCFVAYNLHGWRGEVGDAHRNNVFVERLLCPSVDPCCISVANQCVLHELLISYISSSSEDLGEDHPGQTVSTVVQCGDSQLQHGVLVLHRTQVQQAAKTQHCQLPPEDVD